MTTLRERFMGLRRAWEKEKEKTSQLKEKTKEEVKREAPAIARGVSHGIARHISGYEKFRRGQVRYFRQLKRNPYNPRASRSEQRQARHYLRLLKIRAMLQRQGRLRQQQGFREQGQFQPRPRQPVIPINPAWEASSVVAPQMEREIMGIAGGHMGGEIHSASWIGDVTANRFLHNDTINHSRNVMNECLSHSHAIDLAPSWRVSHEAVNFSNALDFPVTAQVSHECDMLANILNFNNPNIKMKRKEKGKRE